MAEFNVVGLDDVMQDMLRHERVATEAVPEMLKAGADVLVKAQKAEAEALKIRDTGDFINSIKATPIRGNDEGSYVDVYPQGKDKKGTRNADKGFIAEFGKSKVKARPWMRTANQKSADEVTEAEIQIWNKYKGG